jgi:hypothetical protein
MLLSAYLIDAGDIWREPTVNAEYGAINDSRDGEKVKNSRAVAPGIGVTILVLALVYKRNQSSLT